MVGEVVLFLQFGVRQVAGLFLGGNYTLIAAFHLLP